MHHLTLTPPSRLSQPTQILVGRGASQSITQLIGNQKPVVLFDATVQPIAQDIAHAMDAPLMLSVQPGDASKSLSEVERLGGDMLRAGIGRSSIIVAIGGGMVTDVAGFLASVFMRGIPSILVPTTLLGMVDAAIGGKTALNVAGRKNMLGTIHHPRAVIADIALLDALPMPQRRHGMAEVIKIAAMADAALFAWLEVNMRAILAAHGPEMMECVARAIAAKIRMVEADDRDEGQRLLLNFGHTVGHAVEAVSEYRLPHGEAVSIGMHAEMALTGFSDARRVSDLLRVAELPLALPLAYDRAALWEVMRSDKKNDDANVRVAVPTQLGSGHVTSIHRVDFLALP